MAFWSVKDTTVSKDKVFVNNTYKDANGNNKLATNGFVPLDPNSTDPIVKTMYISVGNDGDILYQRGVGAGTTRYTSIQDAADGQIAGYNQATTAKLQAATQSFLSNKAKSAGVGPAVAPDPPAPTPTSNPNNGPAAGISTTGGNPPGFATQNVGKRLNKYSKEPLVYPLKRQGYGGDYIQFEIRTYEISGLASPVAQGFSQASDVTLVGMEKRKSTPLAYIYLPIQSGISDSMSVEWGTGELNPITAAFANYAYNTINASGSGAWEGAAAALKGIQSGAQAFSAAEGELRQMMINYFVERAVNTPGLLSRTMGAALNNNLELLFTGPTLRNFTFNFKLTPREPKEAAVIKDIIRYFKKSMVPGLSNSKLFLLAPNVFKIKYVYTGKGNKIESHPYLNKIKVAALRDFSVNYTPDGNYMTYGADGSMTQYDLSMSFGEIDPIYEPDYEEGEGLNGMGW
jgi:hypothetical protein